MAHGPHRLGGGARARRDADGRRCGEPTTGSTSRSSGRWRSGAPEVVDGIELTRCRSGNPHAVVLGRPEPDRRARPATRDAPALSRADERAGRARGRAGRGHRPGLGARRGGDGGVRDERRRGRGGDPRRRARSLVHFPGGDLRVRLAGGRGVAHRPRGAAATTCLTLVAKSARTRNSFARYRRLRGRRESYPALWVGVC